MPKRSKDDLKSSKAKKSRTLPSADRDTGDSDSSDDKDVIPHGGSSKTDLPPASFSSQQTGASGHSSLSDSNAAGSVSGGGKLITIKKQTNYNLQQSTFNFQQQSSAKETQLRLGKDTFGGGEDTNSLASSRKSVAQNQGGSGIIPSTSSAAVDDPDDQLYRSIKQEFISKVNPKQLLPYLPLTPMQDERVGEVQDKDGRVEAAHFLLKVMITYKNWGNILSDGLRNKDVGMAFLADIIEETKRNVKYGKPQHLKRQISSNGNSPGSKRQHVSAIEKDSAPFGTSFSASTQGLSENPDLMELIDNSITELENWKEELFYETHSTKVALQTLLRRGKVFLVGRSGDGKTASGYHMLTEVTKRRHLFKPIIVSSPEDLKRLPKDNYFVVFVDNIFGVSNFNSVLFETWKSHFRRIKNHVKSGTMYFIAASSFRVRDQCLHQLQEITLLEHVVDTTTKEFCLRDYEKEDMLTEYLEKYEVEMSDSDKKQAVKSKIVVGFPQCCKHFVTNRDARNYGPQFFQKPFFFLKRQINNFKLYDKVAYLVLVMVIFKKGKLYLKKIRRKSLDVLKGDFGIPSEVTKHDIKSAADSLCYMGYLIYNEDEDIYEFSHLTIYSTVCLTLSKNEIPKILKDCHLSFLLGHTGIDKTQSEIILIPPGHYKYFFQRLVKEIRSGEFKVLQHSAFRYKHFVRKVFENSEFTMALQHALSTEDLVNKLDQSRIIYYITTSRNYSAFLEELLGLKEVFSEKTQILHDILEGACSSGDMITLKRILSKGIKPCSKCVEEAAQSRTDSPEIMEILNKKSFEHNLPEKDLFKMLVSKGKTKTVKAMSPHVEWSKFSQTEQQQLLLEACSSRKFDMFEHLLKFVELPEDKSSILKTSVIGDCEEIVKYLLMNGANVNAADVQGRTPLHHACLHKLFQLSELLVKKGACPTLQDKNGATPFHLACQNGSPDFVRKLLSLGLKVLNSKLSPFHFAARNTQHGSELFELLKKGGAKLDIKNSDGLAPIHEAIQCSNYSLVKKIVGEKDLVTDQIMLTSEDGRCPLHFAGALSHGEKLIELLMENAAVISSTDIHGRTALHLAAAACLPKNVETLLKHEAEVNAKDQRQQTPLHCALASGRNDSDAQNDTIEHLYPHTILTSDIDGNSVVHVAVKSKIAYEVLEKLFVRDDCSFFSPNSSKETPLHLALVQNACVHTVKLLLEKFPNFLESDTKCHLQTALEKEAPYDVIRHLLDGGASFDSISWENISLKNTLTNFALSDIRDFLLHCEFSFRNSTDKNGIVPLLYVSTLSCDNADWCEIMDMLTTEETLHLKDKEGSSAMHLVAESPDFAERLKYLLMKGANKNGKDHKGNTPLHIAAKKGNKEGIRVLLEHACVLQLNLKSESALHMIADLPALSDCIESIESKGADLNVQDFQGNTPLHLAVKSNNMNGVKILLDLGARLDTSNHTLQYPLHFVASTKNSQLLELLIRHGADLNVGNNQEETLLHLAVQKNCIELVEKLLDFGCDVNPKEGRGFAPVHFASMSEEHNPLLQCLISRGGTVSLTSLQEKSPLHLAAEHCCPYQPLEDVQDDGGFESEVVSVLIANSAEINAKDAEGFTPVHYAVSSHGVLRQLAAAGGNLKQRIKNGQTCLHLAMMNPERMASTRYLLEKGLSPFDKDSRAFTPLHMAVHYGCDDLDFLKKHVQSKKEAFTDDNGPAVSILHQAAAYAKEEVVAMLIHELPELQMSKDMDGKLPIHYAVVRGDVPIVRLFCQAVKHPEVIPAMKSGSSGNPKNLQRLLSTHERNGRTLLHEASQVGNAQTVDFLLKEGYEVNRKDNDNNMPLHSAAESGSVEKVERLLKAGAVTGVYNSAGLTPLLIASGIGSAKVLNILIHYGGSVSTCSKLDRRSPLHMVCGKNYDRFVANKLKMMFDHDDEDLKKTCELLLDMEIGQSCTQLLIENGAKLNVKDVMGKTPLHLAAENDNDILVKVLLNRGATMSAVDKSGKTALHVAVEMRAYNAAWCMVDRGADLLTEDNSHRTPADGLLKLPLYWQQSDPRIAKMLEHLSQ